MAGTPPEPPAFPPTDDDRLADCWAPSRRGGAASTQVRVWPGRRGLLDAVGRLLATATGGSSSAASRSACWAAGSTTPARRSCWQEAVEEPCDGGYQVRHRFESRLGHVRPGRPAVRSSRACCGRSSSLENVPAAAALAGRLPGGRGRRAVEPSRSEQVYAGHGNVIRDPRRSGWASTGTGWPRRLSGFDFAGGLSLVQAVDVPPDAA